MTQLTNEQSRRCRAPGCIKTAFPRGFCRDHLCSGGSFCTNVGDSVSGLCAEHTRSKRDTKVYDVVVLDKSALLPDKWYRVQFVIDAGTQEDKYWRVGYRGDWYETLHEALHNKSHYYGMYEYADVVLIVNVPCEDHEVCADTVRETRQDQTAHFVHVEDAQDAYKVAKTVARAYSVADPHLHQKSDM